MEINYKKLIKLSLNAQKNSYSPYSKFSVGASLLTKNGKIYTGANIENASYPAGICAERVAMSKAISEGENSFVAICITASNGDYAFPCGICRQFISEFSDKMEIIIAKNEEEYKIFKTCELLPHSFNKNSLN